MSERRPKPDIKPRRVNVAGVPQADFREKPTGQGPRKEGIFDLFRRTLEAVLPVNLDGAYLWHLMQTCERASRRGWHNSTESKPVMTWTKISALVLFAVALACGQILFKAAAQSIKGPIGFDAQTLFQFLSNPFLLLGLALYAFAAFYWVLLLREIELSKAYLIIALALVLVPLAGTFLFREPFSGRLFIGIVVILVGLAVAFW